MRSIASFLGAQFIVENNLPVWLFVLLLQLLVNWARSSSSSIPTKILQARFSKGLDYEAIYILDSAIFDHGDFGKLTDHG